MLRGLLIALLAATWISATQPSLASGLGVAAPRQIEQRLTISPDSVRVGEPLRVRVEVWHPPGTRVEFELPETDPEGGWWWQDLSPFASLPVSEEPRAMLKAVAEWTMVPLEQAAVRGEAGWSWFEQQRLPSFQARLIDGIDEFEFRLGESDLRVLSNLTPETLGPPNLRGLPEPLPARSEAEYWRRAGYVAGVSLFVFLAGLVLTLRGTRSAPAPLPPLSPRERWSSLAGAKDRESDSESRRNACFELTSLCRDAVDARQASQRRHLTDEEWIAEVQAAVGEQGAVWLPGAERLLRLCRRAKYAGEPPSGWAMEELHGLADKLLLALEAPKEEVRQ